MIDKKIAAGLLIAVAIVILLVVIAASSNTKSAFCGALPDPSAASEAKGLFMLGVRPEGFCGANKAPSAVAEYQGLTQLGWRPEQFSGKPADPCGDPHPHAISEAQSLQHAGALKPGAPYHVKSHFAGARRSTFDSVRENFGGPAGTGYGWTEATDGMKPVGATGSWGPAAKVVAGRCTYQCLNGCVGDDCDSCATGCEQQTQLMSSGQF